MKVNYSCATDQGKVRKTNQDYFGYTSDENIFIVTDGMGGTTGGEIASKAAVEALQEYFHTAEKKNTSMQNFILGSYKFAGKKIKEIYSGDSRLYDMGTTVVMVQLHEKKAFISHIGDSRAYLLRNGKLKPLLKDHSLRQEHLDAKIITQEEFENHPCKNIITRYLGPAKEFFPDIKEFSLKASDILILCTDGLHGELPDQKIEEIISSNHPNPEAIASELIKNANNNGGTDNVTVVVIQIEDLS